MDYNRDKMWDMVERPYDGNVCKNICFPVKDLVILEAMVHVGIIRAYTDKRFDSVKVLQSLATRLRTLLEEVEGT